MKPAICVSELRKSYGTNQVLKGVSFDILPGEIFGILGVNGAGKTTMLECIEGFRRCESGRIQVEGKTGVQLQSASLPAYIRPMEAVHLFEKWKKAKADPSVLEALEIGRIKKKLYMELSTGQKRRLHLALALIGDPQILFLDEPTAGLDVEGRRALHDEIRSLASRGKTVVLASHDMAEVEELCSRILILNQGRVTFLGTVEELAGYMGKRYRIKIRTVEGEEEYPADNLEETLLRILQKYKEKHVPIQDIQIGRGTLEEHFIELAKEGV